MQTLRIRVLGAGIVGLTCALELRRRGHRVEVVDPDPGSGATRAAAGMLSPAGEAWHGEADLLALGRCSAGLWPGLAAELGVPLHRTGSMLVAHDAGDGQELERHVAFLAGHGERVEVLDRRGARELEPALSRAAVGAALLPEDHSVDPREAVAALLARVPVVAEPGGSGEGEVDLTVLATGARLPEPWAGELGGLLRGVRGEIVRARCPDPPTRTLRALVRGTPVYVVPRGDGRVVVGATSEEHDTPPEVSLGGLRRLLEAASTLLPGLDRATLDEVLARDRPGTPDNRPLVGPTHLPGVLLAAGHHRHGVLLAPLTARLLADHLETGVAEPAWDPRRFDSKDARNR